MLQFPRTREVLWDHEETGPSVTLQIDKHRKPEVLLPQQVLRLACRHCESERQHHFQGWLSASVLVQQDGSGIIIQVDRLETRQPSKTVPGDITFPMEFSFNEKSDRMGSIEDYKKIMESAYSKLSGALELSDLCSCQGWCSFYGNQEKSVAHLQLGLVTLCSTFRLVPVPPVPILPTGLSKNLAGPSGLSQVQGSPKTGYLTMNETRKLIVVFDTEPQLANLLVVGVWVSGVSLVDHPFVWAACSRYLHTGVLRNRECWDPFLLLLYSPLHSSPEFYDCFPSKASQPSMFSLYSGYEPTHFSKLGSPQQSYITLQLSPVHGGPQAAPFLAAQETFHKTKKVVYPKQPEVNHAVPDDIIPRSTPAPYKAQRETVKPMVPEVTIYCSNSAGQDGLGSDWEEDHHGGVGEASSAPRHGVPSERGIFRNSAAAVPVQQTMPVRSAGGFVQAMPVFTPSSTAAARAGVPVSMATSSPQVPLSTAYLPSGGPGAPGHPGMEGARWGDRPVSTAPPHPSPSGSTPTLVRGMSAPAAPHEMMNGHMPGWEVKRFASEAHMPATGRGQAVYSNGQEPHVSNHGAHLPRQQPGYGYVQVAQSAPGLQGGFVTGPHGGSGSTPWVSGPVSSKQPPCLCCQQPAQAGLSRNLAHSASHPQHPVTVPNHQYVPNHIPSSALPCACGSCSAVPLQRLPGALASQRLPAPAPQPHPHPHPYPHLHPQVPPQPHPPALPFHGAPQSSHSVMPAQQGAPVSASTAGSVLPSSDCASSSANLPRTSSAGAPRSSHVQSLRAVPPLQVSLGEGAFHINNSQGHQAESMHSGKSSDDSGLSVTPEHLNPSPKCESPHTGRSMGLDPSSQESQSLAAVDWDRVPPEISQILIQQALQLQQLQSQIQQLLQQQQQQPSSSQASANPSPQRVDSACNTTLLYPNTPSSPSQSVALQTSPEKGSRSGASTQGTPYKAWGEAENGSQGWSPENSLGQTPQEIRHRGARPLESTHGEEWEATPGDLTAVMSRLGVCEQTVDTMHSDLLVDLPSFQASSSTRSQGSQPEGSGSGTDSSPILSASMCGRQDSSAEEDSQAQALQNSDDTNFDAILANVRQFLDKHSSTEENENGDTTTKSTEPDAEKSLVLPALKNGQASATDMSFLPRIEYMSMLLDSDANLSTDMNAMALKYLPDEALTQVMRLQQQQRAGLGGQMSQQSRSNLLRRMWMADQSGTGDISFLGLSPNNITMGTREYLEKYGLLGNENETALDSTLANEPLCLKLDFSVMMPEDGTCFSPQKGGLPPSTPQQGRSCSPAVTTPRGFGNGIACASPGLNSSAVPSTPLSSQRTPGLNSSAVPSTPLSSQRTPLRERVNGVFTPSPAQNWHHRLQSTEAAISPLALPPHAEVSCPSVCSRQSSDSASSSRESLSHQQDVEQPMRRNQQRVVRENRVDENGDRILDINKLKQLPKFL